jgi:hypothetical protein
MAVWREDRKLRGAWSRLLQTSLRARSKEIWIYVVLSLAKEPHGDEPLRPRFVHAPPRNISNLLQHAAVIHSAFKSC